MSEKRADLDRRRANLPSEKRALLLKRLQGAKNHPERSPAAPDTPRAGSDSGPVSFQQEGLLFLETYYPGLPQYNVPVLLRLRGNLRPEVLSASLDNVVARHDALRTRFSATEVGMCQTVTTFTEGLLHEVDLSGLPESRREEKAMSLVLQHAQRPANFASGPLISAVLYKISANEHFLSIVIHHVIFDGWSVSILLRDLFECYKAQLDGKAWRPKEFPIQYVDYCAGQRTRAEQGAFHEDLAYWQKTLHGRVPELAFLHCSSDKRSTEPIGNVVMSDLSQESANKILAFCRMQRVTLYATLLATWKALLYRYSGEEDIWVGSASAGRNSVDLEPLIGYFVNTLVMRTSVSSDLSFAQLVNRVGQGAIEALEHRSLPFEILVHHLAPHRTPGKVPLVETMFVVQNTPSIDARFNGLDIEQVHVHNGTSKFPLTLQVFEERDRIRLELEYDTQVVDANIASRLLVHFQQLLKDGVTFPDKSISELSMLTENEKHLLLHKWNSTESDYPRDSTVVRVFEGNVSKTPKAPAIENCGECKTYEEVNTQANRLGNYLISEGMTPGSIIAVCTDDIVDYITVVLGILKAGCAYLPLDPTVPRRRNAEIIQNAKPALLLASKRVSNTLTDCGVRNITIEDAKNTSVAHSSENLQINGIPSTSVAYVMYTSGSTGEPKGVCVPHRAILRLVLSTNYISILPEHRVAQCSNLAFDASTFEIWGPLLNGACIVCIPRTVLLSPKDLKEFLGQKRVDAMWVTVGLFNRIIARQPDAFACVGTLISGGDVLSPTRARQMLAAGPPKRFLNGYGPTECTTFSTWYEVQSVSDNALSIPIGLPISNSKAHVLGPDMGLLPIGIPGELFVAGDGLAVGYLGDPDLTQKKFVSVTTEDLRGSVIYATGDMVVRGENGVLEFLGRVDGQTKLRGFRIELEEIEKALRAVHGVRDAIVIVRQLDDEAKELVAYFIADVEDKSDLEQIRGELSGRLPDYMVPALFVRMTDFPLNVNGKVDKCALPEPSQSRAAFSRSHSAPETDKEKQLAATWTNVLGRRDLSRTDNFFDVGGDSLLAMRLQQKIEENFHVQLSVRELFEYPRLYSQALRIQQILTGDSRETTDPVDTQFMVPLRSEGSRPPLFFITGAGDVMGIYGTLVSLLDQDLPFFGFPDPMYTSLSDEELTVERLAETYLKEVRIKQPKGPYYLGGYSVGGIVAFEMARRLYETGEQVAKLVVLDSAPPENRRQQGTRRWFGSTGSFPQLVSTLTLLNRRRRTVAFDSRILLRHCLGRDSLSFSKARAMPSILDYARWSIRDMKQRDVANEKECTSIDERRAQLRVLEDPHLYRRYRSSRAALRALRAYAFPPYAGHLTVICAERGGLPPEESNTAFGWNAVVRGGVNVHFVPGTHTSIFKRPDVESVAQTLEACLQYEN